MHGARVHNLKNLSISIPLNRLVAFTGVSGSGKSSLAHDLLFAEGQRRYLESLAPRIRQAIGQAERGDFDRIDGLPATVCIDQRAGGAHPRSTLATLTEIADFLRLLFARAGEAHCPQCGQAVSRQSSDQIVDRVLAVGERRKAIILAPLVRGQKGEHSAVFESIIRQGFVRARVDGALVDAASPPALNRAKPHTIEVVVDRIIVKDGIRPRLAESVGSALRLGNGQCIVSVDEEEIWKDLLFSERFACPTCGVSYPDLEPRTLSFNSPYGACPECDGLGALTHDAKENPTRSARKASAQDGTVDGAPLEGSVCPDCRGARLNPFARSVIFSGQGITRVFSMTVAEAAEFFAGISRSGEGRTGRSDDSHHAAVLEKTVPEILSRLRFLSEIGLGYLSLERTAPSLSGGELQRARLAASLGRDLSGVCYILDEPTAGLHPVDTNRLILAMERLRRQENSVIVVEHDLEIVRRCDWVIDLGPGAGRDGGRIIGEGPPEVIAQNPASLTGRFLSGHGGELLRSPVGQDPNLAASPAEFWMKLANVNRHNLQDVTLKLPLGRLIAVTGVSGSGKSSLIADSLVPAIRSQFEQPGRSTAGMPANDDRLTGWESLKRLVHVDQTPLGKNSRSTPATYTGLWDEVRKLYARTKESRLRGFTSRRFSNTDSEGRCSSCRGLGTQRIRLDFLQPVSVECPTCRGRRFNRQTLSIRFRGKNVADLLAMQVDEAMEFFASLTRIRRILEVLSEIGLGYLALGQSASTLSGGESQRVKLASELSKESHEPTLFVLDEPTSGLHPADVERLVRALRRFVDRGHTVVVVEHHLGLIAAADWMIELGPGAGAAGGKIIAEGIPVQLAMSPSTATTAALSQVLRVTQ